MLKCERKPAIEKKEKPIDFRKIKQEVIDGIQTAITDWGKSQGLK
jgi:hypothetical protein